VTFTPDDGTNFATALTTVTVNIAQATPTVQVSDAGGPYTGNPFVASATVAGVISGFDNSPGAGLEGVGLAVTYYVGTFTLSTLPTSGGFTSAPSAAGSYTVVGSFPGSQDYASSEAFATFTISPAATKTSTVSLSSSTAVYGQPVTLSVTVSNTQTSVSPSGTVGFFNGSTELGTAPVGAGGTASLVVSTLAVGRHELSASYSDPTVNFAPSKSPTGVPVTITKAGTATTVTATTTAPVFGQAVTFTATVAAVAPSTATPTGVVTFMDGSTVLQKVSLSGGSASFTTSKLAVSSHSITAVYSGTGNLAASTSAATAETVSRDATAAIVTASVASPVLGQSVTLKATVTAAAPGSGKPTGVVSFYDGTTLLGTATLSNNTASIKTTALSVGANVITVVYGGDSDFQGTTSPPLAVAVKPDSTKTSLSSSSTTAAHGTPVTFAATVLPVSPGSGVPTGTVSFWDGSTFLGTVSLSNGIAALTYRFQTTGKHKITAVYNGDVNFLSSTSSMLTETII
jgi:hypothetical protein